MDEHIEDDGAPPIDDFEIDADDFEDMVHEWEQDMPPSDDEDEDA